MVHMTSILVLSVACIAVHTDARRRPDRQDISALSNLSWSGSHFRGQHLRLPRSHRVRNKRFVTLGSYKSNLAYQSCILPGAGEQRGRCRHLQYCVLEDFRQSFPRFLDYMCVIERSYVGVCCPDRPDPGGFPPPGVVQPNILEEVPESSTLASSRSQPRGCGVSSKAEGRLVGGKRADRLEWPWMAALLRGDLAYCGGVLISNRHVLTAAHCIVSFRATEIMVRLGEYDFATPEETRFRDFRVVDIRRHEDFQRDTYENDIAILRVHRPVTFDTFIWPVCLPPLNMAFDNKTAVITGWGTLSFGGPVSKVLMEVDVPVWEQELCVPRYSQPILDTMLCAGEHGGGKDACQGDSGGPLLYQLPNRRWITIGVVSWGIRCGNPERPGVYTRVNRFLAWIYKNSVF